MSEMSFFMSEMYIIIIINKKLGDFMKKINFICGYRFGCAVLITACPNT